MTKPDKNIRMHYFRAAPDKMNTEHNITLPGAHGKDPKTCKACVSIVVAEIRDGETAAFVGVAIRNDCDQFNRKIGRAIALGRAKKNQACNIFVARVTLDASITESYSRKMSREQLKEFWHC